jgi:hypothetical protein
MSIIIHYLGWYTSGDRPWLSTSFKIPEMNEEINDLYGPVEQLHTSLPQFDRTEHSDRPQPHKH